MLHTIQPQKHSSTRFSLREFSVAIELVPIHESPLDHYTKSTSSSKIVLYVINNRKSIFLNDID